MAEGSSFEGPWQQQTRTEGVRVQEPCIIRRCRRNMGVEVVQNNEHWSSESIGGDPGYYKTPGSSKRSNSVNNGRIGLKQGQTAAFDPIDLYLKIETNY